MDVAHEPSEVNPFVDLYLEFGAHLLTDITRSIVVHNRPQLLIPNRLLRQEDGVANTIQMPGYVFRGKPGLVVVSQP